jgi:uncharacterized protein (TIGR02646 family)
VRQIHLEGKAPNKDWLKRAKKLTDQLRKLTDDGARHKLIEENSSLWRELEPWLRELSHGKCWYSEARDCVAYWHVDHFRPKKEAKDLNGDVSPGYWWLAFKWQNYRLAGSAVNVPKSTKFPIRKGTTRVTGPHQDEADESPCLLDPVSPDDPGFLSFDEKGKAIPCDPVHRWNCQRAEVTIDILNLNYDALTKARQVCWEECDRRVNRVLNLMEELQNQNSATMRATIREVILELRAMTAEESEFSAVAITCVLSQGIEWLAKQVLQPNTG